MPERMTSVEIEIATDDPEATWGHRTLVGEQAIRWLSTNVARWIPTEHPGEWNHNVCMAVMAAMESLRLTDCPDKECIGCRTTEAGIVKVLALLPERYQDACLHGFEVSGTVREMLDARRV